VSSVAPLVVVIVGIVLVVTLGILAYYRNKKRVDALAAFCLGKGWQFSPENSMLTQRWSGDPFNEGHSRRARDVVSGTVDGRSFVAFDYSYVTQESDGRGGTTSTTHHYAICALALPSDLPRLCLTPENALTRLGRAIGVDDIELESEEFNRRYRVTCPDPKFASDVLTPRTMEMLLARPSLHFRVAGTDLLCWENGKTDTTNLLARTSTLSAFVAGIPSFVWHDHGVGHAPGGVS
jgi:hypothetical protein